MHIYWWLSERLGQHIIFRFYSNDLGRNNAVLEQNHYAVQYKSIVLFYCCSDHEIFTTSITPGMIYIPSAGRPSDAGHYDTLRRAHHRLLTRCIGWRKHNNRGDHPISYLDTIIRTGSESIETTSPRRRILFAGFVARMEDTRLPKCVVFEKLVGGVGCVGGQEKEWVGCSLDDLRAFGINSDQWTTAA